MKSLMHLVRIDEAIDALKGVFPGAGLFNYLFCGTHGFVASNWLQFDGFKRICTRAEFEARKAERQNKPSWDEHDYKFIHQGKNGHWYGSLKDNPASLPDIITDECWYYIEAASARRGEVFGDYRSTLEQRPSHIGEVNEKTLTLKSPAVEAFLENFQNTLASKKAGAIDAAIEAMRDIRTAFANQAVTQFKVSGRYVSKHPSGFGKVEVTAESGPSIDFEWLANQFDDADDINAVWALRDKLHHKNKPETSLELSIHLSNAFNELQVGARLLPEDDARRAQLVSLAAAVNVIREVV